MELFDAVRKLVNETTPPFGFVGNHDVVNWLVLNRKRVSEVLAQHAQRKSDEPLQRGDRVKLKESQQVVIDGQRAMLVIPAGERAVFISDGPIMGGLAVIELNDLQHGPMRVIVKLSNLERA